MRLRLPFLALLLSLGLAAPAQAVITLGYSGTTISITGTGDNATFVGFSNSGKVTVRNSTGVVDSTGGQCPQRNEPALGAYFDCPGAADAVVASYGAGSDEFSLEGVCIQTVTATLGDGANRFLEPLDCALETVGVHTVTGGAGVDWLRGGSGRSVLSGGDGPDQVWGGPGDDQLDGGPGDDEVRGEDGNDAVQGGDGADKVTGGAGNDTQDGGAGDDQLGLDDPDPGADDVRGGAGTDLLDLGDHPGGSAILLDDVANDGNAGEGDNYHADIEQVWGSSGPDTYVGTAGDDKAKLGTGADVARGGPGNDELDGESDNDQLFGDDGADTLYGGYGDDRVEGGAGMDSLFGDYGACSAYGCASGNDQLFARDGVADALNCGGGADSAQVDTLDVIGGDGFQACETVDKAAVAAPAPAPAPGPGATPGTTVRLTKPAAKGGKRRFTVTFRLDRAATVSIGVTRKGAKMALGTVRVKAKAGRTTAVVRRVGRRTLKRGTYRLVLRAGATRRTLTVRVR